MAISFPSSPSINQQYTYGGLTWYWTGQVWKSLGTVQGLQGTQGIQGITGYFPSTVSDANSVSLSNSPGFLGMPQNLNSSNSAYTFALSDMGKHIYNTYSSSPAAFTIPANSSIAFPVGATIAIVNNSGTTCTVAITSDTLILAGTGATGTRTLANYAVATLLKITSTTWIISGNGLS